MFGEKVEYEGPARAVDVDGMEETKSGKRLNVWNFRLEILDKEGNVSKVIPVQLIGRKIRGFINEGDTLFVRGKQKHGTVKPKEIINKTTNSKIKWKK